MDFSLFFLLWKWRTNKMQQRKKNQSKIITLLFYFIRNNPNKQKKNRKRRNKNYCRFHFVSFENISITIVFLELIPKLFYFFRFVSFHFFCFVLHKPFNNQVLNAHTQTTHILKHGKNCHHHHHHQQQHRYRQR